jgi:hypothetical protein
MRRVYDESGISPGLGIPVGSRHEEELATAAEGV